jgi:hypothetical protein
MVLIGQAQGIRVPVGLQPIDETLRCQQVPVSLRDGCERPDLAMLLDATCSPPPPAESSTE